MATIATTTNTTPFEHQTTLIDRAVGNGNLYCMVKSSTANQYDLYRSVNNGVSWALFLSVTRANVVELGSIFVLDPRFNQLVWCYRTNESSQDRVYYRAIMDLGAATPTWTSEVLVRAEANGGVAGAVITGLDIKAFVVPGWRIFIVIAAGVVIGGMQGAYVYTLMGLRLDTMATSVNVAGTNNWRVTGTGRSTPSLEIEHNGDGKTASQDTPHLWLAFGRSYLGLVKLAWNGGGWTGPPTHVTIRSDLGGTSPTDDAITGRYDGSRFVMAIPNPSDTSTVAVHERNKANTSTVTRVTPTHPTGVVKNCTVSYNSVTGDLRVFAIGTSTTVLYYVDFIRATSSWGSWATVLATAVLGTNGDNYCVRRGSFGNARYDVATMHAANTATHTQLSIAYAPNTPTWNLSAGTYTNGGAADVNASLLLDWDFSDPDVNDVQGSYAVSRQIGAGALSYWRASDSTWQASEVQNTSGTSAITLGSGWAAGTDANYTFKVKVWDVAGSPSAYSAPLILVPSVKSNPTITSPTPSQVMTSSVVPLTWTVGEQSAYRVRTIIFGLTLQDSGWVFGTTLTYTSPEVFADGFSYTYELQTRNLEGLASNVVTRDFSIDFIEPATPTLVCMPVSASGWIQVAITNPAPGGGQPVVAYQDLYRRVGTNDATMVRVATNLVSGATYLDWQAAAVTNYQYRAQVFGVNNTSAFSAWTA